MGSLEKNAPGDRSSWTPFDRNYSDQHSESGQVKICQQERIRCSILFGPLQEA